jgi:hypothetical protein
MTYILLMSNSIPLNPFHLSFRPDPEQIDNEGMVIRDIDKIQIAIDIVNRRIGKLFPGTFITTETTKVNYPDIVFDPHKKYRLENSFVQLILCDANPDILRTVQCKKVMVDTFRWLGVELEQKSLNLSITASTLNLVTIEKESESDESSVRKIFTEYGFKTKLYKKYSDYYVSQMNQKFNSTSNGVIVDTRMEKPKSTLVSKLFSLFS